MKKAMATILMFVIIVSANAYAEEMLTSTILYESPSSYVVQIPDSIYADGGNYNFTATTMDLKENEQLQISVVGTDNGVVTMHTASGERAMTAQIYINGTPISGDGVLGTFRHLQLTSPECFSVQPVTIDGAGDYSGNITFAISLVQN